MKQGTGEEEVLKGSSQNWLNCQTQSAHHTHNGQKQTPMRPYHSKTARTTKAKRRFYKLPGKSKLVLYKEAVNGFRFLNSNTARRQLYKILKFAVYSVPFLKKLRVGLAKLLLSTWPGLAVGWWSSFSPLQACSFISSHDKFSALT